MDLTELSVSYGIDLAELTKVEGDLRKRYAPMVSMMAPEQIEKYITTGLKNYSDRFKNLGLSQYFGVILTLSQPKNGVEKRRSTAVIKYVENPLTAIESGFCAEYKDGVKRSLVKGMVQVTPISNPEAILKTAIYLPDEKVYIIPLDERATWPSGKKNFRYLTPLPLEQYFTNLTGIASLDGTTWEPFKMTYNCDEHINISSITVPQSKLIKLLAKPKSKAPLVLNYNNKYTNFEIVEGDMSALNAEIMNYVDVIQLNDIETTFANRKTPYDVVSVFGSILSKFKKQPTDENPYPWMAATITDTTRDAPLKLIIHPDMSAEFSEQSLVKVWGSLSEGKKWDPELGQATEEKEISMFVTGVHTFSMGDMAPINEEVPADDGWGQ